MESVKNSSVILFIPEAGIYPYLRGLAVLGDSLLKGGKDVYVTRCTGQMLRCPMISMFRLSPGASVKEKKHLCKICAGRFEAAQKKYGFSVIELANFVDEGLYLSIQELISIPEESWKDIIYKSFPVGQASGYDFSLESKAAVYTNLSDEHRLLYAQYIKNTALSVELSERICRKIKPSLLIVFNPYAQCQGACYSAQANNANWSTLTYPTHYNVDASRFLIKKSMSGHTILKHLQSWDSGKEIIINNKNVFECWKDTIFRSYNSGSHIFSKKKSDDPGDIFNQLGFDSKRKTIVAYTSSYDEISSFENMMNTWGENIGMINAFSSQIEWLFWLRNYVQKRDDIQIVVRIHPREGVRQFGHASKHLQELRTAFPNNTKSFVIIWPDDQISSYDLMELADLCLVPWTTMGTEVSRVGVPVLSYTGNMYYPDDDFIQVATIVEEYEDRLTTMIKMDYNWKHLVKAVRYYSWRTFITSLDLGETVPIDFDNDKKWPSAPDSSIAVINDILFGKEDLFEYNKKKWKESLLPDAEESENEAMRYGIRLFLEAVFYPPEVTETFLYRFKRKIWRKLTGKDLKKKKETFSDYFLTYSEEVLMINEFIEQTKMDKSLRVIVADGPFAILIHEGKLLKRMSPMVVRLARLHEISIN